MVFTAMGIAAACQGTGSSEPASSAATVRPTPTPERSTASKWNAMAEEKAQVLALTRQEALLPGGRLSYQSSKGLSSERWASASQG